MLSDRSMLLWLVGLTLAVGLRWRRRFPEATVLVACAVCLVLPLDPVAALIALGSMMVRRVDRVAAALGVFVSLVVTVSIWRDTRSTTKDGSFWNTTLAPPTQTTFAPMAPWAVGVLSMVLVGATVGLALLIRYRARASAADASVVQQQMEVDHLNHEVARQAEREHLAREVHDALGHRLSLVCMHAGALETLAQGEGPIAESAAFVRSKAQQSMHDLSALLQMLREPDASGVATHAPTLTDVSGLIDESVHTGIPMVSTVELDGLSRLEQRTSQHGFRITQELLTNARRHAPGIGVRVRVRAAPEVGVEIEVANHLAPDVPQEFTPGNGLRGVRRRVESLDGEFRCFVDDHRTFRVATRVPWRCAEGQEPGVPAPSRGGGR